MSDLESEGEMQEKVWRVSIQYETVVMAESEQEAHSIAVHDAADNDLEQCDWTADELVSGDALPNGWDLDCEIWNGPAGLTVGGALGREDQD